MPVMPIATDEGKLTPSALLWILAIMTNPNDEEKLLQAFAVTLIGGLLKHGVKVTATDELLQLLVEAPSFDELKERTGASVVGGYIAGRILCLMLNAALYSPEHASISKAIHVLTQDMRGTRTRDGKQFSVSERTFKNHWKTYRSVAHLWGAYHLFIDDFGKEDPQLFVDDLERFLFVAERLRAFGENHRAPHSKKFRKGPTLDPSTTWKVPEGVALDPAYLTVPDLTEWTKERLREYRAKKS